MTLIEVSLAGALLALLLLASFTVMRSGLRSWSRMDVDLDMFQAMRTASDRWTRDFRETSLPTVSVTSLTAAFGSARNDQGVFITDTPVTQPIWQRYVLYYLDASDSTLRRREIPITPPSKEPGQLASVGTYCALGKVMLRNVQSVRFALDSTLCSLELAVRQTSYGAPDGQTARYRWTVRLTN